MLKKYIILAVFIIATTINCWVVKGAFAYNLSSNDELVEAPEVAVEVKKDDYREVGVSGSYLSSQFSRSSGDIENAIKSLKAVYQENDQNVEIANQLMGLYLLNGNVDNAMEIASNISKTNATEPISALMLSLLAIKNNDAVKASHILNELSENEGGQLWLPLISAWLDVDQHKLLKPLVMEELSAEVGRAAPIVNYHLALINAQAGFINAAAENFKQSMINPTYRSKRVMQMLLLFYKKHTSKVLKSLVAEYSKANRDEPKVETLVIDNMQDGTAEVLLTMGSIMLEADVIQDATLYLQLALYLNPNIEIATVKLAMAYGELQQYGIANELLAKIKPTSSLYNRAQLYIAINLGHLKNVDESIVKLDKLISESPDGIEAYMAKGDLLRSQEKFADAIIVYEAALATLKEKTPRHWSIFFAIGTCFDRQGNWVEAEKNFKLSLELSPNQPDVLNYLGYSYLMRGENLKQAKKIIEKALKIRPTDPQIMDSMGWVLYTLGNYKQAVVYLEMAVSLLPADSTTNEHLGDVYWRLGRKTEARFQWDRSLTYSKDEFTSQEVLKKLKYGLPQANSSDAVEKEEVVIPVSAAINEHSQ
ncbi:MAG: tetratricopeptide repeat protein [Rickettsiales bacterium]|jgi:tetratricopeptide (TPR) repeat protein